MDFINDKKEGKNEKDDSKDNLNSVLFSAAYSEKNLTAQVGKDNKFQQISSKILPDVVLNFDDLGATEIKKSTSPVNAQDLLGKQAQVPNDRKGSDPRAEANGSPGWNDFTAKKPEVKDNSILGTVKDFLKPDYSSGDNRGNSAAKTKDSINDLAPGRALSQDSGGSTDKISPPLPVGIIFDQVSASGSEILGRTQGRQASSDDAAKQRQEQEARDRKAKEDAAKEQEKRDQEQKDRERKAEEQKQRDQKEKDDQQKTTDQKQQDDDKKKKGTPNPDSDRPMLSRSQIDAARADIGNNISGRLTTPQRPGGDNKLSSAPNFGKFRDQERNGNPNPLNEGNNSSGPDGAVERPKPKVDVRNLGRI